MKNTVRLSIRELLELDVFSESKILSGESNLDRKVSKINIIVDSEIGKWIKSDEFLISTSFFFKTMNKDEQIEFIKMLNNKKIACLGIKFAPHFKKLDKEVIEYAKQINFVIFSINYKESFTNITSKIYETVFKKQNDLIIKITNVYDRAMELLLEGGNIYDIINTLEEGTKNRAFIVDNYFDKYFYTDEKESEDFIKNISIFNAKYKGEEMEEEQLEMVLINGKKYNRYSFPLEVKNKIYGYIIYFIEDLEYTNIGVQLIESVSTVVALYFYNKLSLEEVEINYKSEFLEDLLSEDLVRIKSSLEKLIFLKMPQNAKYQIIQFIFEIDSRDTSQILKYLHKIKSFMNKREIANVLAILNGRINLLYKYDDSINKILMEQFANNNIFCKEHKIIFGRKVDNLLDIVKSYKDCNKIFGNKNILKTSNIINYDELGVYKLFIYEELREELVEFYKLNLDELIEYDTKRKTDLLKTLRMYFESNGNLRKMSEKLFTHYNTILYRMERIQEITGKKLDIEDDRFDLQTSLKIYNIFNKKSK